MNPVRQSISGFMMVIICIFSLLQGGVLACTSIVLKAEDGTAFDWHVTHLRNYINLTAVSIPSKKIEDLNFAPISPDFS